MQATAEKTQPAQTGGAAQQVDGVTQLRERVDRETRFRRVLYGYETQSVDESITQLRGLLAGQEEEFRAEREALMRENDSLRRDAQEQSQQLRSAAERNVHYEEVLREQETQIETARVQEREAAARLAECQETVQSLQEALARCRSEAEEIAALREERGALQAQCRTIQAEAEQAEEAMVRVEEENRRLNEQLEQERKEVREYRLKMLENLAHIETLRRHMVTLLDEKMQESSRLLASWQSEADDAASQLRYDLGI